MSNKKRKELNRKESNEQLFYSLHSIINEMVFDRKTKPLVYRKFASLLISNQRESVIEFVLNAIISCFIKYKPEEELVFSDPNSVASFFVNMTREYPWIFAIQLSDADPKNRYRMVLILRSLFSLKKDFPTINICRELLTENSVCIWDSFLSRFTDIESEIRIVCVQTAEVLLETQFDEQIVSNLQIKLTKRFGDTEPLIRSDTADAVDSSSIRRANNILDQNLMKHMIGRIGDSVLDVRKRVLICCSNVFHTIIRKYPKTEQSLFYKLPSGCLRRYCLIDDFSEEKALTEMIFCNNLIDTSADNSTKMNNLLKLVCFCDNEAVKAIAQLFNNQKKLRYLFLNFISLIERNEFRKWFIKSETDHTFEILCQLFSNIDNIDQVFKNFHHLLKSFSNKINCLRDVFESKSVTCQQSVDIISELFDVNQEVIDKMLLKELRDEMIPRCGIGLIDCNALICLFQRMKTVDQNFAQRLASLVILLSTIYTDYFNDESVIIELLGLPPVVIAFIASDSMLPFMKCSQDIKEKIKEFVAQNSNHINKSISQISLKYDSLSSQT